MKSSKWILGLMVVVLVMALAPSSYAQMNIQIFNTASPQEITTARNANTSDPGSVGNGILVSAAIIAPSPLTTTFLVLTFPAPLTSTPAAASQCQSSSCTPDGSTIAGGIAPAVPSTDPIRITGATGLFAGPGAAGANNVAIATMNWAAGTITLILPGFGSAATTAADSGTFRLVGVRMDVNGKTAPLSATAGLSSSSNNYILQTTSFPVINAVGAGIASLAQGSVPNNPNLGTALIFTNQTTALPSGAQSDASIVFAEGFASAWRSAAQVTTTGAAITGINGTLIRVTISGLPSGVQAVVSVNTAFVTLTNPGPLDSTSSTSNVTYVQFVNPSMTTVESFEMDFTLQGTPTGTLTPGSITVTATMGPVGAGLNSSGQPNQASITGSATSYIRFAQADVGPVTIGSIVAANTTLLIPYAVRVGAYDTGIAVANTTLDPFGTGAGGATPTAGTLTITMFPRNATGADPSFALTTSSTVRPGVGLSTSGTLVAGGVWTALMSDIMTAAGKTGDYFGYIFIQANFLDAHGAAYIFNGTGFTSATPVLVLPPPAGTSRNGTVEQLNN